MKSGTEKDNFETSNILSLCNNIVSQINISKNMPVRCSKIVPTLKRSLSSTRKLYKSSVDFEQKSAELSDSISWLRDNYSFIEEDFISCISCVRSEKSVLGKDGLPLLFCTALQLLNFCEGKLEKEHVSSIITACDTIHSAGLGVCDFASAPSLLRAAVLCHIGKCCENIYENGAFTDNQDSGRQLINSIKSIKFLSICDFESIYSKCKLEILLSKDPSGAYPKMTSASKAELLHNLGISAKRQKITDNKYAKTLLDKAVIAKSENEKYIGSYIENNRFLAKLYFPVLFSLSVFFTLLVCLFTSQYLFFVLCFPIFESTKIIVDTVFSRLCRDERNLPSIDIREIPDDAKTLCVITALLAGKEHDFALFDRIEKIRNANSSKNIRFGLLCDLPDSDSATNAKDSETVSYACERIESLNAKYGKEFVLFVRKRSYSKSEKRFMAYERKRGAVIELIKLIKKDTHGFEISCPGFAENTEFIEDVKYIITLDADTNLGIDGAMTLVGKMLHPANRAIVDRKNHNITAGYGILQPRMSPDLSSARSTPFTRLICGAGGTDLYSDASFDVYQSLFGRGIFCGKGIIDADAFYETVIKADIFPDDRILSHDILEGERAHTALLCDTELTDGFPKNELSYIKRKHRWIRGDIQNLIFLKKRIKKSDGTKTTAFSPLSKYKIFDNVRRVFTPVFSFALIPLSFFFDAKKASMMFFTAFSPCILPFLIEVFNVIRNSALKSAARRFFSKGITVGIWQSFLRMLFFGCMLAKDAFLSIGASLLAAYRMIISKRKLLEWVTAAQSDSKKSGIRLFVSHHIFSSLAGISIFMYAPGGMIRFSGLAFFAMPFIGFFTSKNFTKKRNANIKDTRIMRAYAADIWKFFKENVNSSDSYLPPDNVQLSPYEKTAHRTSPTNIGLYLASTLAALDFGFIDADEVVSRMSHTIDTIEKLPKWHGHLFNWYDTKTCRILEPKYISSVDSGNFIACLIATSRGLSEYSGEQTKIVDIIARLNKLISDTDFIPLYNEDRQLFSVGVTVTENGAKKDDGCYDFLMSEARILSYVACAQRQVPSTHWKKLSRPMVSDGGYIGLSSWSGTAFEFFMPNLFMPANKSSMLYEAMLFAYRGQSKRKVEGVWGISESGYFDFDCDLNYQYKAFGVPILAKMNLNKHELVISPYSSFLSMCVSVNGALHNLSVLEKLKAYGKYGFYEALDFTPSRVKQGHALIKSYMSHHLGMSMLALSNACFDKNFVRRFMTDPKMQSASELLEEKIPVNARIKKLKKVKLPDIQSVSKNAHDEVIIDTPSLISPICACISDGKLSCTISDVGHIEIKKGDCQLILSSENKFPDKPTDSFMTYLSLDGRIYGMSMLCDGNFSDSKHSFSYSECSANHFLSCEKGAFSVGYTISPDNNSVLRIKVSGKANIKNADLRFVFTPCLSNARSYAAHPAFSELFIESIYDEDEKILYFIRRKRSESEQDTVLAVAFYEKNLSPVFSTRKKFGEYDKYSYFSDITDNICGACINPYCIIGCKLEDNLNAELLIVMTHEMQSAKEAIIKSRKTNFDDSKSNLSETASQIALSAGISSLSADGTARRLLSGLTFIQDSTSEPLHEHSNNLIFSEKSAEISRTSLWKHSISGDDKIAVIDTGVYFFKDTLEKYLRAFKLLTMKNKGFDLIILFSEVDKYERLLEKRIRKLVSNCKADGFLERKKRAIRLVEKSYDADVAAIVHSARYVDDITFRKGKKNSLGNITFSSPITIGKPTGISFEGFDTASGVFTKDAFVINKYSSLSPQAPFAHILSGENISCVLTQDSLGYTFVKNASECRITPISSGGNRQCDAEKLYLSEKGKLFDLLKCAQIAKFSCGKAEYFGKVSSLKYHITVFCADKLSAKAVVIDFDGIISDDTNVFYTVEPCMGEKNARCAFKQKDDSTVIFKNPMSATLHGHIGHVSVFSSRKKFATCDKASFLSDGKIKPKNHDFACVGTRIAKGEKTLFVLGASKNERCFENILTSFSESAREIQISADKFCNSLIPKISFSHKRNDDKRESLSKMFNLFLPYDAVFSRILARSGFYQSGGAYGFRDQLQDCLCLVYSDKRRALSHIYRAASHQFPEGDVLHWWHEQTHSGVRTKCSDDYLWLVYACTEYLKLSGDHTFLKTNLPYITARALFESETERYGEFSKSHICESLYSHNTRALDRAISLRGEHGLCLMGSCDWCDGYSLVGKNMKGESTFTTMFLIMLLERFIPICKIFKDTQHALKYDTSIKELKYAVTENLFEQNSGYFIRGFYDDGLKLGSSESHECQIDIMAQSFTALANINDDMSVRALLQARKILFDESLGIMKLLSPPFDKTEKDPGYIKGYLPGVRENGGQYTHGALFYALSCFEMAEKKYREDKELSKILTKYGSDVLLYSNPAFRSSCEVSEKIRNSYKTEPYAVAADIYSNSDHSGRGGWTHYTGACVWMYRLILRYVFGIEFVDIDTDSPAVILHIDRHFPMEQTISEGVLKINVFGFDLSVEYVLDEQKCIFANNRKSDTCRFGKNVKRIVAHI